MHVFYFSIFVFSMQTYYFTNAWFRAKLHDFLLFLSNLDNKRNGHSRRFRIMFVWLHEASASGKRPEWLQRQPQDQPSLSRPTEMASNTTIVFKNLWTYDGRSSLYGFGVKVDQWKKIMKILRKQQRKKERRKKDRKKKESMKKERKNDR